MAQAHLVQTLKALRQVGLDKGSGEIAAKLIPSDDPLYQKSFGGDEKQL